MLLEFIVDGGVVQEFVFLGRKQWVASGVRYALVPVLRCFGIFVDTFTREPLKDDR